MYVFVSMFVTRTENFDKKPTANPNFSHVVPTIPTALSYSPIYLITVDIPMKIPTKSPSDASPDIKA